MISRALIVFCLLGCVGQASALCIVNHSQDAIAFVRGEPFAGMETYFTGTVRPGAQHCRILSSRADGTFPVSVYTVAKRGECALVRGCFYSSHAE